MVPKYSKNASKWHPWAPSGPLPPQKAAKVMILGCPWEAIGAPLCPIGPLLGTFGNPLTSLFEEKSAKNHLREDVPLLVHFFIDF